jgi:hypothetical protein
VFLRAMRENSQLDVFEARYQSLGGGKQRKAGCMSIFKLKRRTLRQPDDAQGVVTLDSSTTHIPGGLAGIRERMAELGHSQNAPLPQPVADPDGKDFGAEAVPAGPTAPTVSTVSGDGFVLQSDFCTAAGDPLSAVGNQGARRVPRAQSAARTKAAPASLVPTGHEASLGNAGNSDVLPADAPNIFDMKNPDGSEMTAEQMLEHFDALAKKKQEEEAAAAHVAAAEEAAQDVLVRLEADDVSGAWEALTNAITGWAHGGEDKETYRQRVKELERSIESRAEQKAEEARLAGEAEKEKLAAAAQGTCVAEGERTLSAEEEADKVRASETARVAHAAEVAVGGGEGGERGAMSMQTAAPDEGAEVRRKKAEERRRKYILEEATKAAHAHEAENARGGDEAVRKGGLEAGNKDGTAREVEGMGEAIRQWRADLTIPIVPPSELHEQLSSLRRLQTQIQLKEDHAGGFEPAGINPERRRLKPPHELAEEIQRISTCSHRRTSPRGFDPSNVSPSPDHRRHEPSFPSAHHLIPERSLPSAHVLVPEQQLPLSLQRHAVLGEADREGFDWSSRSLSAPRGLDRLLTPGGLDHLYPSSSSLVDRVPIPLPRTMSSAMASSARTSSLASEGSVHEVRAASLLVGSVRPRHGKLGVMTLDDVSPSDTIAARIRSYRAAHPQASFHQWLNQLTPQDITRAIAASGGGTGVWRQEWDDCVLHEI